MIPFTVSVQAAAAGKGLLVDDPAQVMEERVPGYAENQEPRAQQRQGKEFSLPKEVSQEKQDNKDPFLPRKGQERYGHGPPCMFPVQQEEEREDQYETKRDFRHGRNGNTGVNRGKAQKEDCQRRIVQSQIF